MIETNKKYPFLLMFCKYSMRDIRKINIAKRLCSKKMAYQMKLNKRSKKYWYKFTLEGREEFFKRLYQK